MASWCRMDECSELKNISIFVGLIIITAVSDLNGVILFTDDMYAADSTYQLRNFVFALRQAQHVITVLAALIVRRLGRRLPLLISHLLMAISVLLKISYYVLIYTRASTPMQDGLTWLLLASHAAFTVSNGLGCVPISCSFLQELLPENLKGNVPWFILFFRWIMRFIVAPFSKDFTNNLEMDGWIYGVHPFFFCVS